jgi:integrase
MIKRRIKKNGDFTYQVRVKDPLGSWFPAKSFDRRIDAERYEALLKSRALDGDFAEATRASSMRFSEFWEIWKSSCRSHASESWRRSQDQIGRDYILPKLGVLRLNQVQPIHVRQVLNGMIDLGRSPQTVRHAYSVMHCIFERAIDEFGMSLRNPVLRKLKPKVPRKSRPHLTPNDARTLMMHSRNHYLGPAIWLGLAIGLRSEAIIALKVKCVDLTNGEIHIRAGYKRHMNRIEDHPKGKDWSVVGMPGDLAAYLKTIVEGRTPDDFVCRGPTGQMLRYEHFNDGLARLCRSAGVPRMTPHELRHSASELWYEMGASDEDIRQLLGHKDLGTMMIYKHRAPDRLRALASSISLVPKLQSLG